MSEIVNLNEITITDTAKKEVENLRKIENVPEKYNLRISVKGGGCSGLLYELSFDEKKSGDTVIDDGNIKLLIDGKSLYYLMGTEIDFTSGLNGKGFVFNNPMASKMCGCGNSFGI